MKKKSTVTDFDKIVQRMKKKGQKLWSIEDIAEYTGVDRSNEKKAMPYKLIHRLVSAGVLISIRKGMYLSALEGKLNPEDFYWPIVKKTIQQNYLGQGIIIGEKALAFSLRDYSLPETLSLAVPKDGIKTTLIGDYILSAHTIRTEKKNSLYTIIKKHASRISIEDIDLLVTSAEHALLESLTTRVGSDISDTSLVERWLKKNGDSLRESVFAEFIPHRYISAANRLKYLASDIGMDGLHAMMVRLIDQHGKGCHLSRAFLSREKK